MTIANQFNQKRNNKSMNLAEANIIKNRKVEKQQTNKIWNEAR